MPARNMVSLTPAERVAVWSRHTRDSRLVTRDMTRAIDTEGAQIPGGAHSEANTWSYQLGRYLEGWAEANPGKIFSATAHDYCFDDPLCWAVLTVVLSPPTLKAYRQGSRVRRCGCGTGPCIFYPRPDGRVATARPVDVLSRGAAARAHRCNVHHDRRARRHCGSRGLRPQSGAGRPARPVRETRVGATRRAGRSIEPPEKPPSSYRALISVHWAWAWLRILLTTILPAAYRSQRPGSPPLAPDTGDRAADGRILRQQQHLGGAGCGWDQQAKLFCVAAHPPS